MTDVYAGAVPAPNYAEAGAAESRRGFGRKLGRALKELRESRSWIKIIVLFILQFSIVISQFHSQISENSDR